MRVGTLVRLKPPTFESVGLIIKIGSPNPIATILWCDGVTTTIHIKYLEEVVKN